MVRRIVGLVTRAEYKRRQAAPGLILTRKAFGVGRRVPVASQAEDLQP
jgi:NAD+ synthase (glutamine-hydrolysing)